MAIVYTLLAFAAFVVVWGVVCFNRLVASANLAAEGLSGVDVQLTRRAELVPNLLETVKGYMAHERELVESVTRQHAASLAAKDVGGRLEAEGALGKSLGRLLALAEAYPELKASQNFSDLHKSLADIESELQMARRYYNGAARNLNIAVASFPSNLVARAFGFGPVAFFEAESDDKRQVPKVDFTAKGGA